MVKHAFIITNPGEPGAANYCAGVLKDADNYHEFLQQSHGGLWYRSEITAMPRPARGDVLAEIARFRYYDYVLVVFSGHGSLRQDGSTVLELRQSQEVTVDELRLSTPGQTFIIDCCRVMGVAPRMLRAAEELVKGIPSLRPEACRRAYEQQIGLAGRAQIVMYSCSPGEHSIDDSNAGGFYSSSLLSAGDDWMHAHTSPGWGEYGVLSVAESHETAASQVRIRTQGRQTPQIVKPRSGPYFPFCVVA